MNRRITVLVLILGVAESVAAAVAARTSSAPPAGHETALHVVAGLSFIAVGVFGWSRPQSARVGALMCAVGFAWFVTDLQYLPSSVAITIATLEATVAYAALAHLFVTFPSGRLRSTVDRTVVTFIYAWTALGNVIPDTLFAGDDKCSGCAHNLLVLHRDAAAHTLAVNMHQIGNMLLAAVVFCIVVEHWTHATPPARQVLAPLALAAGPIELAIISLNVVGVVGQLDFLTRASPVLTPVALMILPFGFLAGLLRARIAHGALGRLVLDLGEGRGAGRLRDALSAALGDPSLALAYWRPDARSWVDADGRAVEVSAPGPERAVTTIERRGVLTAALMHDAWLLNDPWLLDDVCAAASLALENERLRADVTAQLAEVRASRSRIVEAADDARRKIERDLHDGAQQRLVSVLLTLRRAHLLAAGGEPEVALALDEAIEGQQHALRELRELASGIHPTILATGGLPPALRELARLTPVEVNVESVPSERLPGQVEATAYFIVSEALANVGKHASAHSVRVTVSRTDGMLCVEVTDDGVGGADLQRGSGLRGLSDRVAALDGRIDVTSPPSGGTRIRATIPCA